MKTDRSTLLQPTGSNTVGLCRLELFDTSRCEDPYQQGRPIPLYIYFPTAQGEHTPQNKVLEPRAPKKFPPLVVQGYSKPSHLSELAPGKHPLIFLNHGNFVAATDYAMIAEELASHGYIVISPQHQLDTDTKIPAFLRGRSFSKHARTIDNLLFIFNWVEHHQSTLFENKIACNKIGLIGHSMGGNALLMLSQRLSGMFKPEATYLLPHSAPTEQVKECIVFIDGEFDYPSHMHFPLLLCLSEERTAHQKELGALDQLTKSGHTVKVYAGSRHISFMDHSWVLRSEASMEDPHFNGNDAELETFWQSIRCDILDFLKKCGVNH